MNSENYCMGCMSERIEGAVCPKCGWNHGQGQESGLYLPVGSILHDRYLIGRVLGSGGFGITYLARDLLLNSKLCIKEFLPTDLATRAQGQSEVSIYTGEKQKHFQFGLEKFLEEARVLAKFEKHPGVVTVRDFFEGNNTAYLVMLYEEGTTFGEYLKANNGKIGYETALKIMMPVMDALREVHKAGLLHRDIAPDNIYITQGGQVKLLDFGAARYSMGEQNKSLSVILKHGYAPEEQYRSRGKQGAWTDIYAVAATFYRAITGIRPLASNDRMEEDTLALPSREGVTIPPRAEAALLKAMSVRAADRLQSMEEFQQALMEEPPPPPQPIGDPPPGFPVWAAAIAGFAVIAVIALLGYIFYPQPSKLAVKTTPENALIFIDGENKGSSPMELSLAPGEYKVEIKKENFEVFSGPVKISKSKKTELNIKLERKDERPRIAFNHIQQSYREAAAIYENLNALSDSEDRIKIARKIGDSARTEKYRRQIEGLENDIKKGLDKYVQCFNDLKSIKTEIRNKAYESYRQALGHRGGNVDNLAIVWGHFEQYLHYGISDDKWKKDIAEFN